MLWRRREPDWFIDPSEVVLGSLHARFFDQLTDWGPATRRAYAIRPGQRRPEARDR